MDKTYTAVEITKVLQLADTRTHEHIIGYPPQARFHVVQLESRKVLRAQ